MAVEFSDDYAEQARRAGTSNVVPLDAIDNSDQPLACLRNAADLNGVTFPELTYAVPGIVPEGVTLVVGAPKAGKSWLLLNLILAVAQGGHALGAIPVVRRRTFYIGLEDSDRRIQARCFAIAGADQIPGFDYTTRLDKGVLLHLLAAMVSSVPDDEPAPLIVVDTLGRAKGTMPASRRESAYDRDYEIGAALAEITGQRPGTSTVLSHHDRKAGAEDWLEKVSGTNAVVGSVDTIVYMSRKRGDERVVLKTTGRDIPDAEYALVFDGTCGHMLDGVDLVQASQRADEMAAAEQRGRLGGRMNELIDWVRAQDEPVTPAQAADALGWEPQDARTYLYRAAKAGQLDKYGRGYYH